MQWISTKEKLPEDESSVIGLSDYDTIFMARYYGKKAGWSVFFSDTGLQRISGVPQMEITHWMPLPEPPKN